MHVCRVLRGGAMTCTSAGWWNDGYDCRVLRGGGMTGTIAGCLGVVE